MKKIFHPISMLPKNREKDFWASCVEINNQFFHILGWLMVAIESVMFMVYQIAPLLNIYMDKRYLMFYLSAIALSGAFLLGMHILKTRRKAVFYLQFLYQCLLLLWGIGLSLFDMTNGNPAYVYIQILVFTSVGIRLPNLEHCVLNAISYLVFLVGLMFMKIGDVMFWSEAINLLIFILISWVIILFSNREKYMLHIRHKKMKEENEELSHVASFDSLLEILNRRVVLERLEAATKMHMSGLYCVMVDVDNFKQYNDTYGHLGGDACLKAVAHTLQEIVGRYGGQLGRYGGEEFVMFFCYQTHETMTQLLEDMQSKIHHMSSENSELLHSITLSIGVSKHQEAIESGELLRRADKALYVAKRSGKDCFHFYS